MRNDFEEDLQKFKLQPDVELNETTTDVNVNELRLEKISQRVTFISILIPVLIIIVLVFTYLDIKKRMTYTEDTGMMEFEKLSKDLESRFSSLSVRQAKLEENIISFTKNYDQALAGLNIKIDKINSALDSSGKTYLTKKEFKPVHDEINRNINNTAANIDNVTATIDQVDDQIVAMTKELKTQIDRVGELLTDNDNELNQIKKSINALEAKQFDEPDIDLKVKLSTLKMKQDLTFQLDQMVSKLQSLSEKVAKLSQSSPPPTQKTQSQSMDKLEVEQPKVRGDEGRLIEEQILQP